MWLVPFVSALGTARELSATAFLVGLATLCLFLSRPAWLTVIQRAKMQKGSGSIWPPLRYALGLTLATGMMAAWILSQGVPEVFYPVIGLAAILALTHFLLAAYRKDRKLGGELVGIALLTLVGPATLATTGPQKPEEVWLFGLLHFLFFSLSIFYVRTKVKAFKAFIDRRDWAQKIGVGGFCLAYLVFIHLVLFALIQMGLAPSRLVWAFLPITLHTLVGIARLHRPISIRRLGVGEAIQSALFAILVVFLFG